MNEEAYKRALLILDRMTNDQFRMKLITHGIGAVPKRLNQSRNKREGHLYGWVKGRTIRADRIYRDKYKVSSWYAFRVWAVRVSRKKYERK